jgi:hypothetical protein
MAKTPAPAATNVVAKVAESAVPAHLQKGKQSSLGNIDSSDLIIPRIKLLQSVNPEVTAFENAKAGVFWHSIAQEPMGNMVPFIPLILRKSYVLWAPRNDERGILARARDGIHWDPPEGVFKVKPKNYQGEVEYKLAKTVAESGLDKFGTSIPTNPNSAPAASLTYEILAYFPDFMGGQIAIILNSRTAVKPAKNLISKIEMKPVDHFGQRYLMRTVQEQGEEGPYFNYAYDSDGFVDEELYERMGQLYRKYGEMQFRAHDEGEDTASGEGSNGAKRGAPTADPSKVSSKF